MKRHKIILILLSALIMMGCGESEIVDERGETTVSTVGTDKYVEAEYYNGYSSRLNIESIEIVDGEKKYGITNSNIGIPVNNGEAYLDVTYAVGYEFDGKLIDNENIYSIFLYHNGNLHKFNVENSDTYIYTYKAKNGESLDVEISFKVTDEVENYKIVGVAYNEKYKKGDHGEWNPVCPFVTTHEFMLDLSENTKVYDDETLETCTSNDIEKGEISKISETQLGKDIFEYKLVPYGCNIGEDFVYKTSDGKYKFGVVRMNENQDYMANYTTFIVCDNEIIPAFDGKSIMNYKGQGDISLMKEIDLNMSKGEHIVYSVTIADKGESYRSRFAFFNVE